ncbi:homogentisate 1,2-dioxygenase, partial [Actinomadura sp. PM05-2]|nr:homogentisate 1,2-dioxygenase [Actinomadura parmotrematis]
TGTARLETTYGVLEIGEGDYAVVPTGTIHRWIPTGTEQVRALTIEARGHIRPPGRYLSQHGQFLEHAPYCERDLRGPTTPLLADGDNV